MNYTTFLLIALGALSLISLLVIIYQSGGTKQYDDIYEKTDEKVQGEVNLIDFSEKTLDICNDTTKLRSKMAKNEEAKELAEAQQAIVNAMKNNN